jgi:hypothetical protein
VSSRLFDPSEVRAQIRLGLERIVRDLPLAHPGPCADCKHDGPLRHYATMELCSACCTSRVTAARTVMDEAEFAALSARLRGEPADTGS